MVLLFPLRYQDVRDSLALHFLSGETPNPVAARFVPSYAQSEVEDRRSEPRKQLVSVNLDNGPAET